MPETSRTPIELCASNLRLIPSVVAVPAYNRRDCAQHIVHIGVGGFHRAHQAVYLDDLLQRGECPGWGICGVGLLPQDRAMRGALKSQDCLYTVVEADGNASHARVIGSILDYLYAPDDPEAVLASMADPRCRIVSLTITEGGYRVNRWTGEFEDWHSDIQHDLEHPDRPAGCFGYLAEALDRRRKRGVPPFTVLSCDNLQHNGDVARKAVLAFAGRRDPVLAGWLSDNGAFPNSMVDRIPPATTDEHRRMVAREFGIRDAWPVVTEPFRQWIVEDRFSDGRPDWEQAGVLMTGDVGPGGRSGGIQSNPDPAVCQRGHPRPVVAHRHRRIRANPRIRAALDSRTAGARRTHPNAQPGGGGLVPLPGGNGRKGRNTRNYRPAGRPAHAVRPERRRRSGGAAGHTGSVRRCAPGRRPIPRPGGRSVAGTLPARNARAPGGLGRPTEPVSGSPLPAAIAAVDHQIVARHHVGSFAGEIHGRALQVGERAQPAHGDQVHPMVQLVLSLGRGDKFGEQTGHGVAGADGVDPDTPVRPLRRQRPGQMDHTRFGFVVSRLVLWPVHDAARHGSGVD